MAAPEVRKVFPPASPEVPNAATLSMREQVRGVLAAFRPQNSDSKGLEAGTVYRQIEERTGQEPHFVSVIKALLFLAESGEATVIEGARAEIGEQGHSSVKSRYYRLNRL